jgi:hypothetical protein
LKLLRWFVDLIILSVCEVSGALATNAYQASLRPS